MRKERCDASAVSPQGAPSLPLLKCTPARQGHTHTLLKRRRGLCIVRGGGVVVGVVEKGHAKSQAADYHAFWLAGSRFPCEGFWWEDKVSARVPAFSPSLIAPQQEHHGHSYNKLDLSYCLVVFLWSFVLILFALALPHPLNHPSPPSPKSPTP